jgi:hypothetical protein
MSESDRSKNESPNRKGISSIESLDVDEDGNLTVDGFITGTEYEHLNKIASKLRGDEE